VANAEVTEEALRLKQENEALRKSVKDREAQVAMVQDEYHRYKETVEKPTPEPAKARRFLRHE
jgi:DNA-binding protein H-NS